MTETLAVRRWRPSRAAAILLPSATAVVLAIPLVVLLEPVSATATLVIVGGICVAAVVIVGVLLTRCDAAGVSTRGMPIPPGAVQIGTAPTTAHVPRVDFGLPCKTPGGKCGFISRGTCTTVYRWDAEGAQWKVGCECR